MTFTSHPTPAQPAQGSDLVRVSRLFCALLFASLLALPPVVLAQPRFDFAATTTVLPKTVVPSVATLLLDVDPQRERFSGDIGIQVTASEPMPAIVLHAVRLQAVSAVLVTGPQRRTLRVDADKASGTWRLTPTDGAAVPAGAHRVDIRYRGVVQKTGEGLFRVDHRVAGRPARMLATQLEATSARSLMPAFDEPVFRTVFELSVRAPAGWQVLSNMPSLGVTPAGRSELHRFAPTPAMPSYLLSVAVGRFDVLEADSAGVPLRFFTAPGKREQARFALASTQQLLPYYAAYFGQPYALPKLDQIAVPGVRQGAMEDWGLISYIEDALLYDPARSTPENQRGVFGTVAHEIAHQWFGNLVSVASWSEIWLNEAFATWMEKKASELFHPEWQTALRQRSGIDNTMQRDATSATRAIRSGPVVEASVFEVFDNITYTKGGAVLTMLEQWIGPEAFQRGLAAYMAERRLAPATAGDLWFHIGRAADRPVAEVAASWTDQPGFPLVEVAAVCEAGRTQVNLKQSRFLMDVSAAPSPAPSAAASPALWQVPVRLSRGDELHTVLLEGAEKRIELPGCDERPLLANAGGRGFYRVLYSQALKSKAAAAFTTLTPADRITLLSDSFALVRAGRGSMAEHFALLAALPRIDDASRAALFSIAASQLTLLDMALADTPAQAAVRAAGRALFAPELARLGWQQDAGEDGEVQRLRGEMIRRLAQFDDAATIKQARSLLAAALPAKTAARAAGKAVTSTLPPTVRDAVLRAVGHHADAAEFDRLLAALRAANDEEERWVLIDAAASGRDPARARRLLDEALAGSLPANIAIWIPGLVAGEPAMVPMAYDFTLKHWDALARLAGTGVFGGRVWLLPGAVGVSSDNALATRMLADQQRLAGPTGNSAAAQRVASVALRSALREREAPTLAGALANWKPQAP